MNLADSTIYRAMHSENIAYLYFWNFQYRHKHFGTGGSSPTALPREPLFEAKNWSVNTLFFWR